MMPKKKPIRVSWLAKGAKPRVDNLKEKRPLKVAFWRRNRSLEVNLK